MKQMPPLRAVGGNVLIRKVALDIHRGDLVGFAGTTNTILQIGEIVGLGGRWSQWRPWQPPVPAIRPILMPDGSQDPNWRPPDLSMRPAILPGRFDEGHIEWLSQLKVGDLVVFTQARAYDTFRWNDEDIIVFPGCWLHGIVEDTAIADHPELRRYLPDTFDTEAVQWRPTSRDPRVGR